MSKKDKKAKKAAKEQASLLAQQQAREASEVEDVLRKGITTLRDRVAPASLEFKSTFFMMGTRYCRTLYAYGYPRVLYTGWLSSIINLDEVLDILAKNDVNIVALSLADTSDYGMLRMIVSDPQRGKQALKEAGITAMLTDVVALRVPHATGSLSKAMHQIVEGEVNIEYMYAFSEGDTARTIIRPTDLPRCIEILQKNNCRILDKYSI